MEYRDKALKVRHFNHAPIRKTHLCKSLDRPVNGPISTGPGPGLVLTAALVVLLAAGLWTTAFAQSMKVYGGTDDTQHTEVVLLSTAAGGCTGTFISQRLIVTAAHCFPSAARLEPSSDVATPRHGNAATAWPRARPEMGSIQPLARRGTSTMCTSRLHRRTARTTTPVHQMSRWYKPQASSDAHRCR